MPNDSEQKMDNYYLHRTTRYNFGNVFLIKFSYIFKKGEKINKLEHNGNSEGDGNDSGSGRNG